MTQRPARYGPFHRRTARDPSENEKVAATGLVWGRPARNIYAGLFAAVKAWNGELPDDVVGYEFYTDATPDRDTAPEWPRWSEGGPDVIVLEQRALVAISVIVTKRHDPE